MSSQESKLHYKPFSFAMKETEVYCDSIISMHGSCLGGFEISGIDPDSTTKETHEEITLRLANYYEMLPESVNLTQYFIKNDNYKISLKERVNPISNLLSKRREEYLNNKNLCETHLFHMFESKKDGIEDAMQSSLMIKDIAMYPLSSLARKRVNSRVNLKGNLFHSLSAIETGKDNLDLALADADEFYDSMMAENKRLSVEDIAHLLGFLSTLDKSYLDKEHFTNGSLSTNLANVIPNNIIDPVNINGVNMLKFNGDKARYARILSFTQYSSEATKPGNIVSIIANPLLIKGSYIIMNRYKPMTEVFKPEYFRRAHAQVAQRNFNLKSVLSSNENLNAAEKDSLQSESQKQRIKDIDNESNIDARHAFISTQILMFSDDPKQLGKNCSEMVSAFSRIGLRVVYEDSLAAESYASLFPCSSDISIRDIKSNSVQYAANSLVYKSAMGRKIIPDYKNEEYLYPFESKDGSPFYYSDIINGKGLVIVMGPTRSGKSFFSKTTDSHFMKYGGYLISVEPDKGGEKIVHLYGEENAGLFKIDPKEGAGFNLFSTCEGADDLRFHEHFLDTINNLLMLNSAKDMQYLTKPEQQELDKWVIKIMEYETSERTFFALSNHCSKGLKDKLSRFVRGGIYGTIFDCDVDAVSGVQKMFTAYNVHGVKDMKRIFPLVMNEIFFRITRLFEDNDKRGIPKKAKMEEFHLLAPFPGVVEKIDQGVRTWGKYMASLSIITQSPMELMKMENWPMLKSAASTFVFFSDPKMDADLYQKSFSLSDAELHHISTLVPRKEAYIIQPDLGISKKIVLDTENEQYIINTSHALEEQLTIDNMKDYGALKGIQKSIKELNLT